MQITDFLKCLKNNCEIKKKNKPLVLNNGMWKCRRFYMFLFERRLFYIRLRKKENNINIKFGKKKFKFYFQRLKFIEMIEFMYKLHQNEKSPCIFVKA